MLLVAGKSNFEINPSEHFTERNLLDKFLPRSSRCTSSPKTQELRTGYQALRSARIDLKSSKPDQKR